MITTSKEREAISQMRLISFDALKSHGSIPRCPNHLSLTILANALTVEEYNHSLIIFISHQWLPPVAEGDKNYPDTAEGDKYELIVAGIEKILETMTTAEMTSCYLWLDYCCLNQDEYTPFEVLGKFDSMMKICDLIFTPVLQIPNKQPPPRRQQEIEESSFSSLPQLVPVLSSSSLPLPSSPSSSTLSLFSSSYLLRGWCRVEMLFAAKIPLRVSIEERRNRMKGRLFFYQSIGKRPHIVYGSDEKAGSHPPIILPSLRKDAMIRYDPSNGAVTRKRDLKRIQELTDQLRPYLREAKVGYKGETNADGVPNGHGRYIYDEDRYYEGDWKDGLKEGKGRLLLLSPPSSSSSSFFYEGEFRRNYMNGKGKYISSSGDIHEGEWKDGFLHGIALIQYSNGNRYEGEYKDGKKEGHGRFLCRNGDVYEGEFVNNKREGRGIFTWKEGEKYEGDFFQDRMHGYGVYWYSNGDRYEGEWKKGKMHGKGRYFMMNGDVYEGEYQENLKHGCGVYSYADGSSVYEGEWYKDKKHGQGKMTWEGVEVYEGEWKDDCHGVNGKWTKHWHLLRKGRK